MGHFFRHLNSDAVIVSRNSRQNRIVGRCELWLDVIKTLGRICLLKYVAISSNDSSR